MSRIEIPLSAPDITDAEIEAVVSVLRTSRLSLGPQMAEFEAALPPTSARPTPSPLAQEPRACISH
jgi:dTDP-4-amino-4,6-dideoxygalactose transaminase